MCDIFALFLHVIVTVIRLARPGGLRSVVAESALVRHQLLILENVRVGQVRSNQGWNGLDLSLGTTAILLADRTWGKGSSSEEVLFLRHSWPQPEAGPWIQRYILDH